MTHEIRTAFLLMALIMATEFAAGQAQKAPPDASGKGNVSAARTMERRAGVRADPTTSEGQAGTAKDTPPSRGVADNYQIGAGDILQISVWKAPDVSVPNVMVRPDGIITVPLLKDIEVAGRTPREVEKLIADGLTPAFVKDANVTVVVTATHSKKIYIIGAVKKEGPLPYTYRMTIMQALSEAGGLLEYAKRKKIYIIRNENGRDYRLDFNYDEVVKGERMEQNIPLLAGDTLVIPE